MSLKIDRVQLEIIVQQDSARQKMIELEKDMKNASSTLNKLKKQFGENSAEYKAQEQVVKKLKAEYDKLFEEIGIGKLSLKELGNRQRELNAILRNLDPSLPQWKQYNQQLKEVNARIKELRGTATETRLSIGKLADGFNRYMGLAAGAVATLTGMTLTMRQCVDEYAKMEEAESQVIKYTGMTRDEVQQLNEEFKAMDTRTPREELNRLAGEAGKLGITGVDNVRQFVEAADMINVALGEDLGEEAVNQIGKLSQMFGDESRSLKDNMLAIGSAVNQVAQRTSASEPYLVQFTARMGGVGKQANMSVTDIMGFASALDQNMLRSEMASTALSGLIMRIYQEPAKYAKLAQMDVQEFTQLVQTDVNQAVLMFLESLNKMGGMAQIAPVLKDMSLSGAEAASVISTLAGNVDMVRREQANANQAFREGTSVIKEQTVQNNTVQAQLDKARKQFQEVRVELGERLQPVMKNMISLGSLTVKGLLELIRIYNEYKTLIIATTTAIAAYTVAVNASVIADKAKVLWTGRIVTGLRTLTKVIRNNPWGLAITAVTALAGLLVDLRRKQDSVTESMRSMERINRTATDEYDKQADRVELLTAIVHNENLAQEQRIRALNELKSIIPTYNGMLDEEGKLTGDNTQAIKDYLVELEKQIKLKAAQEELEELYRRKRQSEKQLASDEANLTTARRNLNVAETTASMRSSQAGTSGTRMLTQNLDQGVKTMRTEFEKAEQAVTKTKEELSGIEQAIADVNKEILSNSSKSDTGGTSIGYRPDLNPIEAGPASTGDDFQARRAALEQAYREEQNLLKEKYLDEQLTQEEYQRQMYNAEIAHLARMKALQEQYGQDSSSTQGQIYDKMIAEADRRYQEEQKMEEELLALQEQTIKEADKQLEEYRKNERKQGLKEIRTSTDTERQNQILQALYDADLITYEEYQRMKTEIAEKAEDRRRQTATQAMQAVSQAASAAGQLFTALQEREISQVEARYDKQIEEARKAGKDTTKLEEEKEAAVSAIKMKYADKQFAANVLQIASDTAVGIMQSYAQMGPILGSIFAALVAAQGAIQIAVAKQQRDEAKGLKSGGYSDEYVDGYTRKGNPDDVAGVIPVHKNEFVANHEAVANPAVKQFLDVFDVAQKKGTIRMLNTTQILEQVRTRSGRYTGGYTYDNPARPSATISAELGQMTPEQRLQVIALLQENNRLLAVLCNKELVVDPRKVRDGIKHVETLERNVRR